MDKVIDFQERVEQKRRDEAFYNPVPNYAVAEALKAIDPELVQMLCDMRPRLQEHYERINHPEKFQ